ncbi:MAG: hypothetical protein GEU95_01185 [Rhizobiales bacterium]|nr:hypothetical protein [Hyphomicrobiales bacterium]
MVRRKCAAPSAACGTSPRSRAPARAGSGWAIAPPSRRAPSPIRRGPSARRRIRRNASAARRHGRRAPRALPAPGTSPA